MISFLSKQPAKNDTHTKNQVKNTYLWCLSYFVNYKYRFFLFVSTGFIYTLAELLIPKCIQYFIDHALPQRDFTLLFKLITIIVVLLTIMYLARVVHIMQQRVLQEKAAREVQYTLYNKLRSLGFSYFEKTPIGESLSLINTEVSALQQLYRDKFPASIRYFLFSSLSVIIMISISWKLTLVMVPCLILYNAVGPILEKKASLEAKMVSDNRVQYSKKVYESVTAISELRAHAAEEWDKERLMNHLHSYNSSLIRSYWFAQGRGSFRRLTYYLGAIVVFLIGPYFIKNNLISVGAFIAFILYYFEVMQRITVFFTLITDQKLISLQAEKLYRFIKLVPDVSPPENPVNPAFIRGDISFKNVTFSYENGPAVLNDFNLDIRSGERVAFVGTSGNGKSTALKLIARFYDPKQGQLEVDGIPLTEISLDRLRESIGFVFQETYLFGASVRENIRFGNPDATEEQIIEAAEAANAHPFITMLPQGYDTPLGERGIKLSGGEKQRIAIARMMIKNPKIILLDEATSSLDNVSEREVKDALDRLFVGKTTIAVAHRLSTIRDFDKIVVMDGGKVAEMGTYDNLISAQGLFHKLCTGGVLKKEESQ